MPRRKVHEMLRLKSRSKVRPFSDFTDVILIVEIVFTDGSSNVVYSVSFYSTFLVSFRCAFCTQQRKIVAEKKKLVAKKKHGAERRRKVQEMLRIKSRSKVRLFLDFSDVIHIVKIVFIDVSSNVGYQLRFGSRFFLFNFPCVILLNRERTSQRRNTAQRDSGD